MEPHDAGHWWLAGNQNGWHLWEETLGPALKGDPAYEQWVGHGEYYARLLRCHYHFGRPYLAYGEMLRPPRLQIDPPLPPESGRDYGIAGTRLEGSAWKAPDGSVGVFFLNYDRDRAHEFTWSADLEEGAGWDAATPVAVSRWTEEDGLVREAREAGGRITRIETIGPWGLVALKLEVAR